MCKLLSFKSYFSRFKVNYCLQVLTVTWTWKKVLSNHYCTSYCRITFLVIYLLIKIHEKKHMVLGNKWCSKTVQLTTTPLKIEFWNSQQMVLCIMIFRHQLMIKIIAGQNQSLTNGNDDLVCPSVSWMASWSVCLLIYFIISKSS